MMCLSSAPWRQHGVNTETSTPGSLQAELCPQAEMYVRAWGSSGLPEGYNWISGSQSSAALSQGPGGQWEGRGRIYPHSPLHLRRLQRLSRCTPSSGSLSIQPGIPAITTAVPVAWPAAAPEGQGSSGTTTQLEQARPALHGGLSGGWN